MGHSIRVFSPTTGCVAKGLVAAVRVAEGADRRRDSGGDGRLVQRCPERRVESGRLQTWSGAWVTVMKNPMYPRRFADLPFHHRPSPGPQNPQGVHGACALPRPRLVGAIVALALVLLPARALAQCSDPAVPQGGFALTTAKDQIVKFIDGAKTNMDVRYPSAKPGSCGWPVVIVCHGFPGSRKGSIVLEYSEYLAKHGYMTVIYDWRGLGDTRFINLPNPAKFGSTGGGEPELLDLAEIVLLIDTKYGKTGTGIADVNRLGITGFSYGANNTWKAAAWSGRPLPTNGRGIKTFPKFLAACPRTPESP